MGFLSPDSKLMLGVSRIADLIVLNLIYLLTCIPIVTIGAANTALYAVCFRFGTPREEGLLGTYFRAFRDNFPQATLLWLILLLFGGLSCGNGLLCFGLSGWTHNLFALFFLMLVRAAMMAGDAFPLLSQFRNSTKATLKNALLLSVAHLPRTVVVVALNVLPWVLMLTNLYLFLQVGVLWVALYFSAAAFVNVCLLRKVFAPYMGEEEAE